MSKSLNKSELINVVKNLIDLQILVDNALDKLYEEGMELSDDDYATVVEGAEESFLEAFTIDELVDIIARLTVEPEGVFLEEMMKDFIDNNFEGYLRYRDDNDDDDEEEPEMDIETIVNNLHVGYNEVPGVGAGYCNDEKDLQNMKMFVAGALAAHRAGLVAMF